MRFGLFCRLVASASVVQAYINPILPGFHADPSILRVGEDYFIASCVSRTAPSKVHDTLIYCITLALEDLISWTLLGHALTKPSQLAIYNIAPEAGIWAANIRQHKGRYYLSTTTRWSYNTENRVFPTSFYVWTDDIWSGEWSDPVYYDTLGYDADLFFDDNGKVLLSSSTQNDKVDKVYGIWQSEIDLVTGTSLTQQKNVFDGVLPLNSSSRPEGPHLYKINGTYYLLIAEGGIGPQHRSTLQRGPSPSGPWEEFPRNPMTFNGFDLSLPLQETGHCDFTDTPQGQWWAVCLATRPQGDNSTDNSTAFNRTPLGRETILVRIDWDSDGWPIVNNNQPIGLIEPGLKNSTYPKKFFDDFSTWKSGSNFQSSLNVLPHLGYYTLRTPLRQFWQPAKGRLRIKGNPYEIGDRASPAALFRKQTALTSSFETELSFTPGTILDEAGISVTYSDFYHDEIGITACPNATATATRCIFSKIITTNTGAMLTLDNATVTNLTYLPLSDRSSTVKLRITSSPTEYTFAFAEEVRSGDSSSWKNVTSVDSLYLASAPPGYFLFNGAYFGIYATGKAHNTLTHADFLYWNQTDFSD